MCVKRSVPAHMVNRVDHEVIRPHGQAKAVREKLKTRLIGCVWENNSGFVATFCEEIGDFHSERA